MLEENKFLPRILYPPRINFNSEGKINKFTNKQQLSETLASSPIQEEIWRGVLGEIFIKKNGNRNGTLLNKLNQYINMSLKFKICEEWKYINTITKRYKKGNCS